MDSPNSCAIDDSSINNVIFIIVVIVVVVVVVYNFKRPHKERVRIFVTIVFQCSRIEYTNRLCHIHRTPCQNFFEGKFDSVW